MSESGGGMYIRGIKCYCEHCGGVSLYETDGLVYVLEQDINKTSLILPITHTHKIGFSLHELSFLHQQGLCKHCYMAIDDANKKKVQLVRRAIDIKEEIQDVLKSLKDNIIDTSNSYFNGWTQKVSAKDVIKGVVLSGGGKINADNDWKTLYKKAMMVLAMVSPTELHEYYYKWLVPYIVEIALLRVFQEKEIQRTCCDYTNSLMLIVEKLECLLVDFPEKSEYWEAYKPKIIDHPGISVLDNFEKTVCDNDFYIKRTWYKKEIEEWNTCVSWHGREIAKRVLRDSEFDFEVKRLMAMLNGTMLETVASICLVSMGPQVDEQARCMIERTLKEIGLVATENFMCGGKHD